MSVPDAPAVSMRDPWPGDPARGARLLKGELSLSGAVRVLKPGSWADTGGHPIMRAHAHGFAWMRDLRVIGTDAARMRARALVGDWIAGGDADPLAQRPDVAGSRIASWLGHYDFFAASADDEFRTRLMWRLVADARILSAALPAEEQDGRALTAIKGLIAASIALPDHAPYLSRALRFLPQEIARQVLPDGGHVERSPARTPGRTARPDRNARAAARGRSRTAGHAGRGHRPPVARFARAAPRRWRAGAVQRHAGRAGHADRAGAEPGRPRGPRAHHAGQHWASTACRPAARC